MNWDLLEPLFIIISIDIILGGDNAVVIALASRNLPPEQRNKAILFGTGLAIAARVLLTVVALYLLQIPFLQLIGGLLLFYIAFKLLTDTEETDHIKAGDSLAAAVKTIVFADIVMGFDNVLAIAGASHNNILLVIIGLLVSVPIIVWGSRIILQLMDKFPLLIYFGAGILAYTAAEMVKEDRYMMQYMEDLPYIHQWFAVIMVIIIITLGYWINKRKGTAI
ncbi:YjbE family putative metal transport protein [Halobacillus litoralis]|uniref:YjbE family putative metal transport protein n=1 Tax=Halobacillus litoralis TaxID=45668 RepID=A0A845DLU1_9BACI|nr:MULTISPECIES: TerC family protein [Halobacillus]MYL18460.1 YjbE family putative metal transport protein [Halobacillus litoralis]MYL30534.1 YjbE family putative metal transport protein [Halobacillus halophilus]